jgi:hypothetical protein
LIGQIERLLNRHPTGRFTGRRPPHSVGNNEAVGLVGRGWGLVLPEIGQQDLLRANSAKDGKVVFVAAPNKADVRSRPELDVERQ